MKALLLQIIVSSNILFAQNNTNQKKIDFFDTTMQLSRYKTLRAPLEFSQSFFIHGSALYIFFKQLYEKNNLRNNITQEQIKIPKIIHHIWLGSLLPQIFYQYVNSWKNYHPEWKHMFWNDATITQLQLYNQDLYDAATNYGQKSDIARYEILYHYGGLYVDTDFECLQPFDLFHTQYDLYTGILPLDTGLVQLGNGLIGAAKEHPLLLDAITNMKNHQHAKSISAQTGPIFFTQIFYQYTIRQTQSVDIAFPAAYFYPLNSTEIEQRKDVLIQPYAVHHWAHSWCDQRSRRPWFVNL